MQTEQLQHEGSPQILVVDDSPEILNLLTEILTDNGYRVRPATDGTQALRCVAVEAPDLILLDIGMSGMDGYEVCRHLKSDQWCRNIPVIFISGFDETIDKIKGFNAGGVDYITKPFQAAEVLARVETHLSLHHLQKQLELQNSRLQQEITERERVEDELKTHRAYLEDLIAERTKDLININDKLQEEIAERNIIQEAVIRAKKEWELTFDAVPDLISLIDRNYSIVRVNKAMAEKLDLLPHEVLGLRCYQVVHNAEVPPSSCPHAMHLTDGQEHTSEIYIEKLSATFMVSVSPLYDDKGQMTHCVHVARDISKRKQLEVALEKSKEQYRSLVESANDIVFRTDTTGVFTYINPIASRISGYSQEELIGKQYLALIRPDMREEIARFLGRQFAKELANTYYEFPIIKKDGQELWIGQNTQLLLENEQVIGFQAVARDITERRQIEAELRKHRDHLEQLVEERTSELAKVNDQLLAKLVEHERAETALRKKTKELQLNSNKLKDLNAALKILLQQREEDKTELEEKVLLNVKHLLTPHFEALKKRNMDQESKVILEILESNTKNMTSSFAHKLSTKYLSFTPTEIKVANFVKEGKQIKEIAEIMRVSRYTIELHRFNIRKKLGLKSRKTNLQSYLLSLS
jgi:PAS domain S-box-containing protein